MKIYSKLNEPAPLKMSTSVTNSHNAKLLKSETSEAKCNCRDATKCPLPGKCTTGKLVYRATVIVHNVYLASFSLGDLETIHQLETLTTFSTAWNTAVLQGHCFEPRLDHLPLESHHTKFQVNPLRNG